jgi:sirohydrochlorin cobaltochelatase
MSAVEPVRRVEREIAGPVGPTVPAGLAEPGTGLLVVGHGTADAEGAEETRSLSRLIATHLPGVPVELGFLEVIEPTIDQAVHALAARGCRHLVAAPLLLFTAGHARRDVPAALAEAAATAGVSVRQAEAMGAHADVVSLSRHRREQALAGLSPVPDAATVLVMLGRGSSDPGGPAQLRAFAEATLADPAAFGDRPARGVRPTAVIYGFAAAARPTLDEAVAAATRVPGVRRIIMQPHLLFQGHVLDQVRAAAARGRAARPDLDWIEVARLGADPRVATAVIARASAAAPAIAR